MLRDHASFQADYPSDGEPGGAAAEPVAHAILDGLATGAGAHEAVLRAAHRVIASLPGAQAIRWYTLAEWNEAPDDHWSSDPVA